MPEQRQSSAIEVDGRDDTVGNQAGRDAAAHGCRDNRREQQGDEPVHLGPDQPRRGDQQCRASGSQGDNFSNLATLQSSRPPRDEVVAVEQHLGHE